MHSHTSPYHLLAAAWLLAAMTLAAQELKTSPETLARGKAVYMQVCFACHQPTGLGLPGMFPPLAGSDWLSTPKPDRLIRVVLHGLTGPVTLAGKVFTSSAPLMPPQGSLSDSQVADVLTFVRHEFGAGAAPVTPEQVAAVRLAEKARAAMWTEAELQKILVD